jgi:hypothetical protein
MPKKKKMRKQATFIFIVSKRFQHIKFSTRLVILGLHIPTDSSFVLYCIPTDSLIFCSRLNLSDAEDEWKKWNRLGDPVLHIDLRDWADFMLVAPLSAHTLAKLAQGLCDDTLSCVVRAWDFGHGARMGKPLILAPAMNTAMWEHPLTQQQLTTIQSFWNIDGQTSTPGVIIVAPQVKTLACGEVGDGALASAEAILYAVKTITRKTSNVKREQHLDAPSYLRVDRAGNTAVNGLYARDGSIEGACKFSKPGKYRNQVCLFSVFQYILPKCWKLSIVPVDANPGTSADIDFYSAPATDAGTTLPPISGWKSSGEGIDPSPTIEFQDE